MDPILQVLVSWQFITFGLAVAAMVYVLRLIIEYVFSVLKKDLTQSNFWNKLVLPLAPIVFGVTAAILITKFPYPGFTPDAHGVVVRGDRIIFGLVAGSLSTILQNVVTSLLGQKITSTIQGLISNIASSTPTATPVAPTVPMVPSVVGPSPVVVPTVPLVPSVADLPARGQP
jgi:hypothetical protein